MASHTSYPKNAGVLFVLLHLASAAARSASLADNPIVADGIAYLDSGWTVSTAGNNTRGPITIAATVPGDVISDLENAGLIGDPLSELNFLNESAAWTARKWTYRKNFTAAAAAAGGDVYMVVFDGVKMGATISVNGQTIGVTTDQFLRYSFEVNASVLGGGTSHTLKVAFDPTIACGGRWMACTGGWDWAPYSSSSQDGAHTFSYGIWKSVYVLRIRGAAITHVVPQIFYSGEYPTAPLADGAHSGFTVDVRVHLFVPSTVSSVAGTLAAHGDWGGGAAAAVSKQTKLSPGNNVVTLSMNASAAHIKLWWPAGSGAQPLYNVSISFTPARAGGATTLKAVRRIGFRVFALVTGNDTDPAYVTKAAAEEGTSDFGLFWRVNGAAVMPRGANQIPMEELEGRMSAVAHRRLVQSAVDGGLNTLRVWGGGMFLPDPWYDACDELGVLVYHDMQFAQQGHAPANTTAQDAELRHSVRRLSSHPSIVVWDGCNECQVKMNTPTGIYATFVMTVVAEEDQSRAVWPSCPALGWTTGVAKLTGMPNGNALTTPDSGNAIETHGPYQHGAGFVAANGAASLQLFDKNLPIYQPGAGEQQPTGPGHPSVFASEFGCSVYSSFESMSPTLDPSHWGIHAGMAGQRGVNPMSERNYPCDNIIDVYFGSAPGDFDRVGEAVFKKHLWQCMVGQALNMKSNIEARRAQNQIGIIVWQYNEIWPTGGWGSIEYGTVGWTKGQVVGGRWKPLHYWYKASIFADVMATCGENGWCFVVNDAIVAFTGSVKIECVHLANSSSTVLYHEDVSLAAGAGVLQEFSVTLPESPPTPTSPPTAPPGDCTFQNNTDWLPKTTDTHWHPQTSAVRPASGPSECCALCDADPTCVVATFAHGRCPPCPGICGCCYLKTKADQSNGSYARDGVWSCKKGKTKAVAMMSATVASSNVVDETAFILVATVIAADGTLASTHPVLYAAPKDLRLPRANVTFTISQSEGEEDGATISVSTDAVALFVTFTTLAQGRFDDNAFLLMPGAAKTVVFHPFEGFDFDELHSSLRVEHVASYM